MIPGPAFEPICELVNSPHILVVNSISPYRTLPDLLKAARAEPRRLTLATPGPASLPQIVFAMLERAANVDVTFVPFSGAAPAVSAILGGHVTSTLISGAGAGWDTSALLRPRPRQRQESPRFRTSRPSLKPVMRATKRTCGTAWSRRLGHRGILSRKPLTGFSAPCETAKRHTSSRPKASFQPGRAARISAL